MIKLNENETLYKETQELIDKGDTEKAEINLIELYKKADVDDINYMISKILINLGTKTKNPKRISEAIGKLKQLDDKKFPRVHFYLGTAYLKKYEVLRDKPNYIQDKRLLYNSKLELKKFISKNPNEDLHNAYVNLGAVHRKIGRTIESIEIDNFILEEYGSEHGLFNKGYSLYDYSKYSDNPMFCVKKAYDCFKIILEDPNIRDSFKEKSQNMINIIKRDYSEDFLETEVDDEPIEIEPVNNFNFYSKKYCWENNLNLNYCDYCKNCIKSTEDSLVFEKMIYTKPNNNETKLSKLSSYLNQIKMDFVSARTLLILSEYEGFDLDSITQDVLLMNTDFPEENDIRIQLLKDSFKNFFNILDKIAVFIKDYLKIKFDDSSIDFKNVWFKPEIKEKLIEIDNPGANALFDIYNDLEFDYNKKYLRDTRNALTHRYLKITTEKYEITDKTVEELKTETLEIAHIVKNAIIYLMRFVKIYEEYKEKKLDMDFIPIEESEF